MRNDNGKVLMHSRSSFVNVKSKLEAQGNGWLWAIESMASLRFEKVMFGVEASDLLGAVIRPPAWPSFRWISSKIRASLSSFSFWKLEGIDQKSNVPAGLIAKSVISKNLSQSYVATGFPAWLSSFFV
ncbi:hypothetical protein N665_0177s0021 [Sinapis alba]|nr:hypothetical protein N665_0177s0021 [Sinapis alba]